MIEPKSLNKKEIFSALAGASAEQLKSAWYTARAFQDTVINATHFGSPDAAAEKLEMDVDTYLSWLHSQVQGAGLVSRFRVPRLPLEEALLLVNIIEYQKEHPATIPVEADAVTDEAFATLAGIGGLWQHVWTVAFELCDRGFGHELTKNARQYAKDCLIGYDKICAWQTQENAMPPKKRSFDERNVLLLANIGKHYLDASSEPEPKAPTSGAPRKAAKQAKPE